MFQSSTITSVLLRAVLIGAAALALAGPAQAQLRIGVTQATENNPIGKPPGGVDRVLRVGTDIQANETVSTTAQDRAHLVFIDGTTLTVGPNSRLTIDKFVYDPATQKGDLAVTASTGVFRLIGGRISKTSEIKVTTPSSTLGIRGGIMVFSVQASATSSIFVYGNQMTVAIAGFPPQTVTLPGQIVQAFAGLPPAPPTFVVQGSLDAALQNLIGDTKAAQATLAAVQTLVDSSSIANPLTLAAILQAVINANSPLLPTNNTTFVNTSTPENPNQIKASP